MKSLGRIAAGVVAMVFLTIYAQAHDLWLVAGTYHPDPDQKEKFFVVVGSEFPFSESAMQPNRLESLRVFTPRNENVPVKDLKLDGPALTFDWEFKETGSYWVALATKPKTIEMNAQKFNEYLEHDGLPNILTQRKEKGLLNRDEVEQYSKFAKCWIQVGPKATMNFDKPLGLKIEIIPLKDPTLVKVGEVLPVQVLLDGKPLPDFHLEAGFESMKEKPVQKLTDAQGKASLPITQKGIWYLRGIHMLEIEGKEYRYESFWASLTFLIG